MLEQFIGFYVILPNTRYHHQYNYQYINIQYHLLKACNIVNTY